MIVRNNRRKFLRNSLLGLTAGLGATTMAKASGLCTPLTPPQTSGPFYPENGIRDRLDLTQIPGRPEALGQKLIIRGEVRDQDCNPVENAVVEIWQAAASGKYAHSNDPNPAPLDPNFLYSGKVQTQEHGVYQFKTIRPGAYPATANWVRPPHIHFKITAFGYETLVTQMYFADEADLNRGDRILQSIPELERDNVVRELREEGEEGLPVVNFMINLKRLD